MNILDRLLEQYLMVDVTETPWWTEGVFRALEQDHSGTLDPGDALTVETSTELP